MRRVAITTAHSAAMDWPSRPRMSPRAATAATQTERTTEGSGPTSVRIVPRTRIVEARRRGFRAGTTRVTVARMMTMWDPETAVRCVREVFFIASDRSAGMPRSSPIAMPGTRERVSLGSCAQARAKAQWVERTHALTPPGRSISWARRTRIVPIDGASAAKVVSRLPQTSKTSPRAASPHPGARTSALALEGSHISRTETASTRTRALRVAANPDEAGAGSLCRTMRAWMGPESRRAGSASYCRRAVDPTASAQAVHARMSASPRRADLGGVRACLGVFRPRCERA